MIHKIIKIFLSSSCKPGTGTKKEIPRWAVSLVEDCMLSLSVLLDSGLGGSETGDRNTERRAADVVDADAVEELD